ncbi:MAG: hypothetical protein IKJ35_07205 [Clostridia bacterium]|nr:hypothetical protein [Clostridia bacterium]
MYDKSIMNTYLKLIAGEILLFLFLCAFIVIAMLLVAKHGWIHYKIAKFIVVLVVALWSLLFINGLIDISHILKDMSENDFVQEKVILVTDEKYNLGTIELYSRRGVCVRNEDGEKIKLWLSDDVYYGLESNFEGTIVYARRSKCIVSMSIVDEE